MNSFKIKELNIIYYTFGLIGCVVLSVEYYLYYFGIIELNDIIIYCCKVQLLFIYLFIVFSSKYYLNWKNLYFFFLFTIAIFLFSRVFLDVFFISFNNFNYATKWRHIYFLDSSSFKLLLVFSLSLILIHVGFITGYFKYRDKIKSLKEINYSNRLFVLGAVLFVLVFPIFLFKLWLIIKFVFSHSYIATYTGEGISLPFWTKGSGTLTVIAYSLILASKPKKKYFLLFTFLFLITQLGILIEGARGGFIVSCLIAIWYYYNIYSNRDIDIKKLLIIGICFIILSQIIVVLRAGDNFYFNDIFDLFRYFLYEQGTSIQVPFYFIEFNEIHSKFIPYILDPFISIGSITPSQNLYSLNHYNNLAYHLTYFINPNAYLNGEGIGNSFIAELYDLPFIIMVVLLFLLGRFIVYFNFFIKYNRILLLLSYILAYTIIWMPRGQFFPNLNIVIPTIIIYMFTFLFKKERV